MAQNIQTKLQCNRRVIIDNDCAGRLFRLSVLGSRLRTKSWACWASTIIKSLDKALVETKGSKMLDRLARKADVDSFAIENTMDCLISLNDFPSVLAKQTVWVIRDGETWKIRI